MAAASIEFGSGVPVDKSVENVAVERINCETLLPRHDLAPIVFEIKAHPNKLIDVSNIFIAIKCKVLKIDTFGEGKAMTAGEKVVPYNGFLYTMFEDIECDLNHQQIYSYNRMYQTSTYIQLLMNTTPEQKQTHMAYGACWYPDIANGLIW